LFNGRDLEGWKPVDVGRRGLGSRWRVFNGAIAASAPTEDPHPPLILSTEREFGKFVLRFEFRKTREPARGNIIYHAVSGRRHAVLLVHDGEPAGTLVGAIRHASGKIRYPLDYAPLKGTNEWNQVEVEVAPDMVRVVMNGVEVQKTASQGDEKSDAEAAAAMKPSRLGFTVLTGELQFRNVEIWE
jgi:hypothetical protein